MAASGATPCSAPSGVRDPPLAPSLAAWGDRWMCSSVGCGLCCECLLSRIREAGYAAAAYGWTSVRAAIRLMCIFMFIFTCMSHVMSCMSPRLVGHSLPSLQAPRAKQQPRAPTLEVGCLYDCRRFSLLPMPVDWELPILPRLLFCRRSSLPNRANYPVGCLLRQESPLRNTSVASVGEIITGRGVTRGNTYSSSLYTKIATRD